MQFVVKAIQGEDTIVSLVVDAADETAAAQYASAQGYSVLRVAKIRTWQIGRRGRSKRFSTLLFSQELLALLSAGLSLIEALEVLQKRKKHQPAEGVVVGIVAALSEGLSFSAAISRYPQHFSPLYIASMQASERTGDLPEALRRFIAYQEQMDRVRKRLISASMYPALLTLVAILVILFLLLYVVPRFSRVYQGFAGELPFFSKALVVFGGILSEYGGFVVAGAVILGVVGAVLVGSARARARLEARVRSIPWLAENLELYELSRLYRTLGMLLRAGIPITRAMRMATSLLSERARNSLVRTGKLISEGRGISSAMEESGLTTPIAARMLAVGERTGEMGPMMERIAQFHEEELSRWLEDFSKLFEPILMLALGLIVGAIVVFMYMPIFELATVIQ